MSTLENTIFMMKTLPEADLLKIQDLAKKLSRHHELDAADEAVGRFLKPMSADDIVKDIEAADKQYAAGEYSSAEEVFHGLEQRRKLGPLAGGLVFMADDFDETPDCFKEYM